MDARHKKLLEECDKTFSKRLSLDSFWQEVAYEFYVEMAEFTTKRYSGEEWADHLSTSYPLIARRTLGDSLSAMLRPVNLDTTTPGVWFSLRMESDKGEDTETKRWLEAITTVQRRAMYDRKSNFVRAMKEGDHSFVTFGQCPLSLELSPNRDTLLYRCWHLRDVAWHENMLGEIDTVYRKWKPTATQLADTFARKKLSSRLADKLRDDPFCEIDTRHIVIPTEKYEQRGEGGKKFRTPYVSIWIDVTHDHVMEEVGSFSKIYIIPRWVTIPGSQYASSPSVTAALPDARLIQAMSLTLLEAGEKFADPPLVATQEAIRSDIQTFAGGVTYVDAEYDEKISDVLRPLYDVKNSAGLQNAVALRQEVQGSIAKAFFLDSLSLPPAEVREMTAFEVSQRISEWIRRAMPIFEPVEFEYNGQICEETFDLLMRNGAFGPVRDMPDMLKGVDLSFKFESPLHEGHGRNKGQRFLEAKSALAQAAELDPSVIPLLNAEEALRDVLLSIGSPAKWLRSEREMDDIARAQAEQEQQMAAFQGAAGAAEVASNLGSAAKDFAAAQPEMVM